MFFMGRIGDIFFVIFMKGRIVRIFENLEDLIFYKMDGFRENYFFL